MPSITISLNQSQSDRVIAALRAKYAGQTLTDAELAQKFIKESLRSVVLSQERSAAENTLAQSLNKAF